MQFDAYYRAIYQDRWDTLLKALRGQASQVGIRVTNEGYHLDQSAPEGMYRMDRASLVPAQVLRLPAAGKILDACAAPGGKTLLLAARMAQQMTQQKEQPDAQQKGRQGAAHGTVCGIHLLANEISTNRRRRLSAVLEAHLSDALRACVTVTALDAGSMCRRNKEVFEAILLDAPCSSERHLLASEKAMAEWSPARSRNLAHRQWALLSSAFLMLKPGGCLVYSTCSIAPDENDGVISRLVRKYGDKLRVDSLLPEMLPESEPIGALIGEPTDFGRLILPDVAQGAGPIYYSRIFKSS